MVLTILIAFIGLVGLLVLHEFGHFILAKKFGVRVDEFGIGYPPRIFGKKIGETIYSLNLLPFGAFVKLPGETEKTDDPHGFSRQAIWKRALIVFGGVLSFWLIAVIIFSITSGLGTPVAIGDDAAGNLVDPKVQIVAVLADSPAKMAGLTAGDSIKQLTVNGQQSAINKVKELQDLTEQYKGREIILTVERGKEVFDVSLIPRVSPPSGEGPIGVSLVRTAVKSYPWYLTPWQGILTTFNMTGAVIEGYGQAIKNLIAGKPTGVEMVGPVGVFHLLTQVSRLGLSYFLQFIGMIAIYIAIFNILPIPAVDGGRLLFLGMEAVRRKPISEKVEQKVTVAFFGLLLMLMVWVTIKDVSKLF